MKNARKNTLNFLIFIILALIFASLQSSLWGLFFDSIPAPPLWIPILIYWGLYRDSFLATLMSYSLPLILGALTQSHLKTFILSCLFLFILSRQIKHRYFWKGSSYFMILSSLMTFAFSILYFFFSYFEEKPITQFLFFHALVQPIEILLISPLLYKVFQSIDYITNIELPSESGSIRL